MTIWKEECWFHKVSRKDAPKQMWVMQASNVDDVIIFRFVLDEVFFDFRVLAFLLLLPNA